jgi:hypothetical protein
MRKLSTINPIFLLMLVCKLAWMESKSPSSLFFRELRGALLTITVQLLRKKIQKNWGDIKNNNGGFIVINA